MIGTLTICMVQLEILQIERARSYLTFRIESMIDSSVEAASFRIDRKAAIRMLSEPLDHRSRHFYCKKMRY